MTIPRDIRRDVLDGVADSNISWAGRLEEPDFLARLWDIATLPSTDYRYKDAAGDIFQHRINNHDWEDDWIFTDSRFDLLGCPDEKFLAFLCETVHPRVRDSADEVERLVRFYNECLGPAGVEIAQGRKRPSIDGPPRHEYAARHVARRTADPLVLDGYKHLEKPEVLAQHLRRIDANVDADPPLAIASSKELVESVFRMILDDYLVPAPAGDDIATLYKKVAKELKLSTESVPESVKGSAAAHTSLRALTQTVQGLSELRNALGTGHGRAQLSPALRRHAQLAATSARAVTEFMLDTWQTRRTKAF